MANLTRTTRNREEIQRWAEERGGKPSHVKRTGSEEDIGILRIDFPGYSGEDTLEPISWDDWFDKFEAQNLVLIFQEETAGGEHSNFNKIVSAETAEEAEEKSHGGSKKTSRKKQAPKKAASTKKATASKKAAAAAKKKQPAKKKTAKSAAKSRGKKAAAKKSSKKTAPRKAATKKAAKKSTGKKRR